MLEKLKDSYIYIKTQMAFSLMIYDSFKGSFARSKVEASRAAKSFTHLGYKASFESKGQILGVKIERTDNDR